MIMEKYLFLGDCRKMFGRPISLDESWRLYSIYGKEWTITPKIVLEATEPGRPISMLSVESGQGVVHVTNVARCARYFVA